MEDGPEVEEWSRVLPSPTEIKVTGKIGVSSRLKDRGYSSLGFVHKTNSLLQSLICFLLLPLGTVSRIMYISVYFPLTTYVFYPFVSSVFQSL